LSLPSKPSVTASRSLSSVYVWVLPSVAASIDVRNIASILLSTSSVTALRLSSMSSLVAHSVVVQSTTSPHSIK